MLRTFLIVGIGSFFGGGSRYLTQVFITKFTSIPFPFGTIGVNIIGSFIIGILFGLGMKTDLISNELKMLLVTGFCGGFTTFSSFSLDTYGLFRDGEFFYAFSYIGITLLFGFFATFVGIQLIKTM